MNYQNNSDKKTIIIKTQIDYIKIPIDEILFCIADGSYSILYLNDGSKVLVSKCLAKIEELLKNSDFIRCHNSYLVNVNRIERFNRKRKILIVAGMTIPVSRRRYQMTRMKFSSFNNQL